MDTDLNLKVYKSFNSFKEMKKICKQIENYYKNYVTQCKIIFQRYFPPKSWDQIQNFKNN